MTADRSVVDFDHHTVDYQEHTREIYADLRQRCPVAWSERYGGYWVVSSYERVWEALRDHDTFSSGKWTAPDGTWRGGDVIPDTPSPPLLPLDTDPPEWNGLRRILNPWLAPKQVDDRQPLFDQYATELMDGVIEKGQFDLILDFANPMPAMATLNLVGIGLEEWHRWAEPHHAVQYAAMGTPEFDAAMSGLQWQRDQLAEMIESRRHSPRDDLLTAVARAEIEGRPLSADDGAALVLTVIGGGVDTTTSVVANVAMYLCRHKDRRSWLIDDIDGRLPNAIEEFLRVFPPVPAVARTVKKDASLGGQQMCPPERALLSVTAANHDASEFEAADEIQLDRSTNRHVTFGIGIHRCVGSNAARAMVRTMLTHLLRRMPDYEVDESRCVRYGPSSAVDGWISVPVTFTPGSRSEESPHRAV
jgi:cytochrome P450